MTRDEIVAFFARRQEAFNRLDAAMLASLHAEDGVLESPFAGGMAEGREAIEQVYRAFFTVVQHRDVRAGAVADRRREGGRCCCTSTGPTVAE